MGEVTYTEFPFKTTPYSHQLQCWRLSKDRTAFGFFMDMGTGKSKVVIDTAGYLYMKNLINAQVIVAPKGMYNSWIDEQLPTHTTDAVPSLWALWSSYARKEERDALKKLYQEGNFLRTLVVNVEALSDHIKQQTDDIHEIRESQDRMEKHLIPEPTEKKP